MSIPEENCEAIVPPGKSLLRCYGQRVAQIGLGHAIYAGISWVFDNILYVWVVYRLGLLIGGAIMMAASGISCALTLVIYQRMKVDWVGAGALASLGSHPAPCWWQRILIWAMKKGDAMIFMALCIFQDPFITTAYFKRGSFDRLTGRDRWLFLGSVFCSNFYWTLRSGAVGVVFVKLWRLLHP